MLNINPQLKKTYTTINMRSNLYNLDIKEDLVGLRFDIQLPESESNNQIDESIIQKNFTTALKETFGWFSVSGKILYTFKTEGKVLPFVSTTGVEVSCEENSYFFTLPQKKAGVRGLTLILNSAGRDLHLAQLRNSTCDHKTELTQFANIWFGSLMKDLGLNELGGASGKYFNTSEAIGSAMGELDIYSGYKISPDIY
jgi:hypothetical protein